MNKHIITLAIFGVLALNSCKDPLKTKKKIVNTETGSTHADTITNQSITNKDGKTLNLSFNNTKGTATIHINGETSLLVATHTASGFWYKNDHYELRGKGNNVELKKDGDVIFTHTDLIVTSTITNKEGQTLDMVFNNTTNTAKIYLNRGAQIDLDGQKPGSGIWYKNEQYELRGKGEQLELTKNGDVIFKN